jgi:hypothetical protein
MPLQEHHLQLEKALQTIQKNRDSLGSPTKQDHTFYTILARAGAGKTRVVQEISSRIQKALPNTYRVRIDFRSGDHIRPQDGDSSASIVLGLRIAPRILFGCTSNELLEFFGANYDDTSLHVFSFHLVMEAFYSTFTKAGNERWLTWY